VAAYEVSQNKLAVVLDVDRAVVNRWFHEQVDSSAETVADTVKAFILKVSMLLLKNLLRYIWVIRCKMMAH
jgi:plasmid maintenance system antidote protein VapI